MIVKIVKFLNGLVAGIRAFHADGDPGDAAGGLRDGARLHLRHPQAPAHDHLRRWESLDTGNEMTVPSTYDVDVVVPCRLSIVEPCKFWSEIFPISRFH